MQIGKEVQAVLWEEMTTTRALSTEDRYTSPPQRASLAQLVEQLTLNQRVEGSNPSGGISPFQGAVPA